MTEDQKKELWQIFLALDRASGQVVEFCGPDAQQTVVALDQASQRFQDWLTKNGCAP